MTVKMSDFVLNNRAECNWIPKFESLNPATQNIRAQTECKPLNQIVCEFIECKTQ